MNVIVKGSNEGEIIVVVDGVDVTNVIKNFRVEFNYHNDKLLRLKCNLEYQMLVPGARQGILEEDDIL